MGKGYSGSKAKQGRRNRLPHLLTSLSSVVLLLVPGALAGCAVPGLASAAAPQQATGSNDLTALTLSEASRRVRAGTVTSVQLTEACLARIATYDPKLDAFITVMREHALAQARALDGETKGGRSRGPLHVTPSPQRRPVIIQAGASGRGRDFAARHAEVIFAIQPFVEGAAGFQWLAASPGEASLLFSASGEW